MTFYEFTSTLLTIIGYSTLVYRIIFDLQSGKVKKNRQEKLCTKWLIFTIFLKVQFYILAIIQILPFGSLLMLVFKLFLFLPQNAISHQIYKRIQKYLQRVKLQQYNSHFSIVLSFLCTYTVIFLMKIICKIAALIDSKHIDQVETQNKEIIKILQYKKAAINMRYQVTVSQVNKELNSSEFNNSVIQEPLDMGSKIIQRTQIGREMSKILVDLDQADPSQHISMKAEQMIIKPNKELGTKAKYENVQVEYFLKTSKITFINKHKAVQSKTLKEVRWITKNMMNIQMVFRQGGSKIIKLKDNIHVVTFVEPICTNLLNIKQQLI